jgi:ABC-type dipeptide/oligopeptide/nickel transport system permease subunit
MATLLALGVCLLRYGMLIPIGHIWHTAAIPSIICFLVWLEVALLIRTQVYKIKLKQTRKYIYASAIRQAGITELSTLKWVWHR